MNSIKSMRRGIGFFQSREKYRYAKHGTNKIQKFQTSRLFIVTAGLFGFYGLSQMLPSFDKKYSVDELTTFANENKHILEKF